MPTSCMCVAMNISKQKFILYRYSKSCIGSRKYVFEQLPYTFMPILRMLYKTSCSYISAVIFLKRKHVTRIRWIFSFVESRMKSEYKNWKSVAGLKFCLNLQSNSKLRQPAVNFEISFRKDILSVIYHSSRVRSRQLQWLDANFASHRWMKQQLGGRWITRGRGGL